MLATRHKIPNLRLTRAQRMVRYSASMFNLCPGPMWFSASNCLSSSMYLVALANPNRAASKSDSVMQIFARIRPWLMIATASSAALPLLPRRLSRAKILIRNENNRVRTSSLDLNGDASTSFGFLFSLIHSFHSARPASFKSSAASGDTVPGFCDMALTVVM